MELDPTALTTSERYKLLVGCITPRPIAWVSTRSPDGADNLAPFSWFNAAGSDPMILTFCVATKNDGSDKDSLRNALPVDQAGSGEFVVNVVVEEQLAAMAACAETLAYGTSEFELAGVTPATCRVVAAPRVAEAPVSFECRTRQVLRFNPGVPLSGNLVVGEVVHVWLQDGVSDERLRVDARHLPTLGRLGGAQYARVSDVFEFPRGPDALTTPLPFKPRPAGRSEPDT